MSRQHDIGHTGVKNEFTPLIRAHEVKRILISVSHSVFSLLGNNATVKKGYELSRNKNILVRQISSIDGVLKFNEKRNI